MALASTINAIPCVSLKSQECKVREVIAENKYMTYPYNVKVSRCNGNCNNITNPYSKVCVTDITKNVTLKVFDLMILTNKTKQIIIHKSCKCVCRLDSIVCNNKQKWNKNKCRCECLINKKCRNKFWNPNSCKCEFRKVALTEEREEINDNTTIHNKETILIKNIFVENFKPFVVSSVLFLSVSVILAGLFVYFYVKSKPNYLPY